MCKNVEFWSEDLWKWLYSSGFLLIISQILGSSPSKKGLWVSRGQSPPLASFADSHPFSPFPKCSCPHRSAQRNPKYCPKRKSYRIGSALRGRSLLQGFPSFPHSPPDCGGNSPFSERTASSASRKCVSFFGIPDLEGFSSCEKAYESVPCANKGLCPFETCKPLKRLDLNFLASLLGRLFQVRKVEYNRRKSCSRLI